MPIHELCAKDVMSQKVLTVMASMTISEVAKFFQTKGITGAPVVDDDRKLVGVVSETDIVRFDLNESEAYHRGQTHPYFQMLLETDCGEQRTFELEELDRPEETCVQEIMTPWTFSAKELTTVPELADMMVKNHIHRILIVGKDSELKGIVTTMDLARVLAEQGKPVGI